jgi:hypothetical protein
LQFMVYNAGSIPVLLFAGAVGLVVNFSQFMIFISISMLLLFWWGVRYTRLNSVQKDTPAEVLP